MNAILFVDDDPSVQSGMRRALCDQRGEWEMIFVESGAAALEALNSRHIDLVVTDVDMPGMSGLELLPKVVNGDYGYLPVVVVTGNGQQSLKRQALDLGAADLLTKPVESEDLIARLRSVLTAKRLHDELRRQNATLEQAVAERTYELDRSRVEFVVRLARAAELRDEATGEHIVRVALLAKTIGENMGLADKAAKDLMLASTLHDVGKISIPDSILRKPGSLDQDERSKMETHAEIGYKMLTDPEPALQSIFGNPAAGSQPVEALQALAANIALGHHERWDGTGYPNGLAGDAIPLEARIVAVADVYDALRSKRPYKEPFTREKAIEIVVEGSGSHFDPAAVQAFLKCVDRLDDLENPGRSTSNGHVEREDRAA